MTPSLEEIAAVRSVLESRYGLALEGVGNSELVGAIASAAAGHERLSSAELASTSFLERLVDRLPIDESSLFRHPALWEWLRREALAPLVDRAVSFSKPVRALSVGCAAGQEPHSLAMLLIQLLLERGVLRVNAERFATVVGMDASAQRVERARSGLLNSWSVQRAPVDWLQGFLRPDLDVIGQYKLEPSVQALCRFEQANVLDFASGRLSLEGYDLVLCQHVFIYFKLEVALSVLGSMVRSLSPGAILVMAPVEAHLLDRLDGLERLSFVGAARAVTGAKASQDEHGRSVSLSRPPTPLPPKRRRPPPRSAPAMSALPATTDRRALAERYVASALDHSSRGQLADALEAARSACAVEPEGLMSRLVLGQILLGVDRSEGRRVLSGLLQDTCELSPEASVPLASELSVAQLSSAVRMLLEQKEK